MAKLDFEFLAIDKRLLGKGLNPTELLVYSQIAEYNRTTGDCFISDKTMAEMFGVSDKTISRALTALEDKKLIRRETKNVRGGKERHIFTTDKMTVDSSLQPTNCPLTTVILSIDNRQNDLIKENIIEKEKDNYRVDEESLASLGLSSSTQPTGQKERKEESQKPEVMTAHEAIKKFGTSAVLSRIPSGIPNCFWINGSLIKVI